MLLILLGCEPKSKPEPQDDTAVDTDRDSATTEDAERLVEEIATSTRWTASWPRGRTRRPAPCT